MSEFLITNESDIDDSLLFYIENEAHALSSRDEMAIDNYADRELFNPSMRNYLSSEQAINLLSAEDDRMERLSLNFVQEIRETAMLPDWLRFRFRRLKRKIKQIFCRIVREISGEFDWKTIIKAVLIALIPIFGGGIPAIAAPIIVWLLARLFKYGIDQTCPA